jgi:hypothetical protein
MMKAAAYLQEHEAAQRVTPVAPAHAVPAS